LRIDRDAPPRRGPWRGILFGAIALGAIAAGAVVARPYLESRVFKTEVSLTEISLVSPSRAAVELNSTGYVVPEVVSQVAAKAFGKIARVYVEQGQKVKKGDVLLELERSDEVAAISASRARVAAARARTQTERATLAETRRQADRAKALAESGVGPKAAAEDLESRVASLQEGIRAAEAEIKAAQAEVSALEVGLGNLSVPSPIDGTVISKPPQVGETLGLLPGGVGNQGAGIEIADLSTLVVETDVPEGRLHLVKLGGPCEIALDAFPTRRYRGKVKELVPRVNRAKATVTVKVAFVDGAEGALPDMSARVGFLSRELDAAHLAEAPKRVVPVDAVVDRGGAKAVFVVEDERVRLTPVKVAPSDNGALVLLEGPAPGTRVVKLPPAQLGDGQRIKERPEE
jgi:RND family efflux transporter MFP subunit